MRLFALLAAVMLGIAVLGQPAECAYCGGLSCLSSANCLYGCSCIGGGDPGMGVCTSISRGVH